MTTNAELKKEIETLKERVKALEPSEPEAPELLSPIDPTTLGPLLGKVVRVVYTDPKENPSNWEGVFEGCRWIDSNSTAQVDIGGTWEPCQNVHALEEVGREPERRDWGVDADTYYRDYSSWELKRREKDYLIDATYQDAWDAVMGKTVTLEYPTSAIKSVLVNGISIDDTGHAITLYRGEWNQINVVGSKLLLIEE